MCKRPAFRVVCRSFQALGAPDLWKESWALDSEISHGNRKCMQKGKGVRRFAEFAKNCLIKVPEERDRKCCLRVRSLYMDKT